MEITQAEWTRFKNMLSAINTRAVDDMMDWLESKGGIANVSFQEMSSYGYALATKYGEASASLSAQMYDEVAAASGMTLPAAEVADTVSYTEIAKAITKVAAQTQSAQRVSDVVGRYTKRTGADTMLKNAERDGAQFAWVPAGDSCAFCIALASRGWQFISKKSFKNGHAEHIHTNCDCTYAVRFDKKTNVAGYDPQVYKDMYYGAEGDTPQEKINSMRRMKYQENKDVINAQKRANYAIKHKSLYESEASRKREKSLNPSTRINKEAYSEKELRKFTESLGESAGVSREIYKNAKDILDHRDGTLFEDLAFIDTTKTKKSKINKGFDYYDEKTKTSACKPSKSMIKMLNESEPETIVGIHNHPNSYAPSDNDIARACERKYKYGLVFCHNGTKYKYFVHENYDAFNTHFSLENLEKAVYDNNAEKIKEYINDLKNLGVDMEVFL